MTESWAGFYAVDASLDTRLYGRTKCAPGADLLDCLSEERRDNHDYAFDTSFSAVKTSELTMTGD